MLWSCKGVITKNAIIIFKKRIQLARIVKFLTKLSVNFSFGAKTEQTKGCPKNKCPNAVKN